jgi:hypothetical protein
MAKRARPDEGDDDDEEEEDEDEGGSPLRLGCVRSFPVYRGGEPAAKRGPVFTDEEGAEGQDEREEDGEEEEIIPPICGKRSHDGADVSHLKS